MVIVVLEGRRRAADKLVAVLKLGFNHKKSYLGELSSGKADAVDCGGGNAGWNGLVVEARGPGRRNDWM